MQPQLCGEPGTRHSHSHSSLYHILQHMDTQGLPSIWPECNTARQRTEEGKSTCTREDRADTCTG